MNNFFKDKVLLITGGTGSFGTAVVKRFINSNVAEIRIFSRDEKKQDDARKFYDNNKVKFYIGDVRDKSSVRKAMRNVDFVFHAAALKQVPSCEFFPLEAVKTNIIGTENVIDSAIEFNIKKVICLSTDKAVYPINAMGISKAMMEKIAIAKSRESINTIISITRYGNVMASRNSVIPLFIDQILNKKMITITDSKMSRFIMTLEDAVDLVIFAFSNSKAGDIFVQKSRSVTLETLSRVMLSIFNKSNFPINTIGTRHGEKLFEVLLSREEMVSAVDMGQYFRIPADLRDLNYEVYTEEGEVRLSQSSDYNSHNSPHLSDADLKSTLLKLKIIQDALIGKFSEAEI